MWCGSVNYIITYIYVHYFNMHWTNMSITYSTMIGYLHSGLQFNRTNDLIIIIITELYLMLIHFGFDGLWTLGFSVQLAAHIDRSQQFALPSATRCGTSEIRERPGVGSHPNDCHQPYLLEWPSQLPLMSPKQFIIFLFLIYVFI